MQVKLHIIRRNGIKMTSREAGCLPPLVGDLEMRDRWVSETRSLPSLQLSAVNVTNGTGLLAILYEPRLTGITSSWMRFNGFEVLRLGDEKQLVVQEWRCYVMGAVVRCSNVAALAPGQ